MDTTQNAVSPQRRRIGAVAAVVVLIILAVVVWQTWDYWRPDDSVAVGPGPEGGPPPPPPGGFSGPPNPEEMRRRFQDRIKTSLAASDEEWAKLRPAIEKVTHLQDQINPPMGMGPMGRGPGPQAAGASGGSELAEKSEKLRAAVNDKETSPDSLAASLAAALRRACRVMSLREAAYEVHGWRSRGGGGGCVQLRNLAGK